MKVLTCLLLYNKKKLKVFFDEVDDLALCNNVEYDEQHIPNNDYSTTGKSSHFEFVVKKEDGKFKTYSEAQSGES